MNRKITLCILVLSLGLSPIGLFSVVGGFVVWGFGGGDNVSVPYFVFIAALSLLTGLFLLRACWKQYKSSDLRNLIWKSAGTFVLIEILPYLALAFAAGE